ncbi:TRAP transporter large permease, partial [Candidatus Aerophobetes bacterium]|nr:TRAP transporter large permease [Candidatus Aerophobetes bacterium]
IVMAVGLAVLTYVIAWKRNYPREKRADFKTILKSFYRALPALITPLIIIGGILGGVFTATEAGAVAVLYALVIGMFVYKELKLRHLPKLFLESMSTTAAILFIVGAAKVFGWLLTYFRFPALVASYISNLTTNPLLITLLFVGVYLFLGCFLEASAIVVMTIPVVMPLLFMTGIDPVFFGVLVAMCMSIGTLTPPLGLVMYVVCDIGKISVEEYVRAILPYLVLLIGVIIIMAFFPSFVLYIPNLMMGS